MTSSPETLAASYVIRGADQVAARLARMAEDLTSTPFAAVGVADSRLVDPHLETVVQRAEMEARGRGFRAGYSAGQTAGHQVGLERMEAQRLDLRLRDEASRGDRDAQLHRLSAEVRAGLDVVLARQEPLLEQLRDLVATMTVELAEALVGHHLEVGGCAARDAVLRALRQVPRGARFVIHLHPDDLDLVRALNSDVDWNRGSAIADATIEPGGVVVVADNLEIDAQMSLALERVRQVLHP
ncbi:MAG TPA: FliH/SctL family protein [Dermatophilaceae bacterium]|nr:FliH/SctL family protein [Dermatophilaceae bacterium]